MDERQSIAAATKQHKPPSHHISDIYCYKEMPVLITLHDMFTAFSKHVTRVYGDCLFVVPS